MTASPQTLLVIPPAEILLSGMETSKDIPVRTVASTSTSKKFSNAFLRAAIPVTVPMAILVIK